MGALQQSYSGRALPPQGSERSIGNELLCGSFGGLCAALFTHPLDTVKTRMQSGGMPTMSGVLRNVLKKDGVRGFYRGISVPAISQPLYVGSSFAGLQAGYFLWDRYRPMGRDNSGGGASGGLEGALRLAFSGGLGGAACAIAVTPGERIKVLLQMQGQQAHGAASKTTSPLTVVRSVLATGGWRSMFVGLKATMVREIPGTIMWFGAFESVTTYAEKQWELSRPLAVLCGAVAAGLTFWLPVIPIDTVKTRQQTAPSGAANGAMDIARQIVKAHGIRGFWAGTAPILARGILLDICQFSGADQLRNTFASRQAQAASTRRSAGSFAL